MKQAYLEVEAYKRRTLKCRNDWNALQLLLICDADIDPFLDMRFSAFVLQLDIDFMMVRHEILSYVYSI